MNAHHEKRSYRHSLPSPAEFLSLGAGSSGKGKGKESRVEQGIGRLPFGYQVSCSCVE